MTIFVLKALTRSLNALREAVFFVGYRLADARWYTYDRARAAYMTRRLQQSADALANAKAAAEHADYLREVAKLTRSTERADIKAFDQSL